MADARYTNADLRRLANDKGPFFADNARQALKWAADVLDAAHDAVQAERARAERAEALAATPAPAPHSVDCVGLALDLEARAKTVESQTTQRAMEAAAHGLRLLAGQGKEASNG